ncbi:MAG: glycosyl hydrolase [Sphingomonas taxi]
MAQDGSQPDGVARRELLAAGGALTVAGLVPGQAQAAGPVASATVESAAPDLARRWQAPPASAHMAAYWYWMGGAVTKEGITADLEAMKAAGISRPMMFSIGKSGENPRVVPPADALTPTWWAMVEHAAHEAERLGLELAMNMCDGWATASGPWITPDRSMQHLIWGETRVDGGRTIDMPLPTGEIKRDYHRDIAVLAVPIRPEWEATGRAATVTTDLPIARPQALADPANTDVLVETDSGGWIAFAFDRPFTLRAVTVRTPKAKTGFAPGVLRAANSLAVEASDDGMTWRAVGRLDYPRHGWQTDLTTLTHALPETTARHFRFIHRPEGPFAYEEDQDFGQETMLRLTGLDLSAMPVVHHLPIKSGAAWGRSRRMAEEALSPPARIAPDRVVDVSRFMDAAGRLRWRAPAGRWRILRIGYTTTGKTNAAAGLGEGLECDRFDPAAAKLQFDSWFGHALDRLGPAGSRALKVLHVDSWEAGTQNWSPGFAAAFRTRRGYDPLPWLAVMAGVPLGGMDAAERFLFDVRRTIAELARDCFYAPVAALAKARGCRFSGEPPSPTFLADGLDYAAHVDDPMGEFWLATPRNDKPTDIKDAVSGARIYGGKVAGAEAFTQGLMTWREHPFTFKAVGDHAFCEGINRFHLHVWAQQPWPDRAPGMTLNGIGSHFVAQQSWWRPGQGWRDYIVRAQALLQAGHAVADVAYFIGEDIPTRALLPDALTPALPPGFAYDSINRDALIRLARVEQGRIVLPGGASYALLVLPPGDRMTVPLIEALARLADAGATIVGPRPVAAHGLEGGAGADARVKALAARLWDGGTIRPTADLAGLLGSPAFVAEGAEGLEWIERCGPGWRAFFLSNQGDAPVRFTGRFRSTGAAPELWDADRASVTAAGAWEDDAHTTRLPIALDPRGSLFVVFAGKGGAALPIPADPAVAVRRRGARVEALVSASGRHPLSPARAVDASVPAPRVVRGPWQVRFAEHLATPKVVRLATLSSWTEQADPDLRFYSGVATYATMLDLPPARDDHLLTLDLGTVAELATVRIGGVELGHVWRPPFRIPLPPRLPRRVLLEIDVANTWRNRLIGDDGKAEADRVTHVVPMLRKGQPWLPGGPGATLDPAGLLGPVRIVTEVVVPVVG